MGDERRRWRELAYLLTPPLAARIMRAAWRRVAPSSAPALPECDLATVCPWIADTLVAFPFQEWHREAGMLPFPELLALAALVAHRRPRLVIEIGTHRGSSTLVMAMNAPPDAEIVTLDLPPSPTPTRFPVEIGGLAGTPFERGERFRGSPAAARIHQLWGDSATFDFSPWHGRAGLIFVDGNHAYENVLADTATAFRCLAPGGVIVWDDYHPVYGPGVMRALQATRDRGIRAVRGTRLAIYVDRPRGPEEATACR